MTEKNYAFFQNNIFNTLYLTLFDLIAKKKLSLIDEKISNWTKSMDIFILNSKIYLTIKLWL